MDDREAIEMMRRSVQEIEGLRANNTYLAPRAEAFGVIQRIFDLIPGRGVGMGEDHVWRLEQRIRELEAKQKETKADAQANN